MPLEEVIQQRSLKSLCDRRPLQADGTPLTAQSYGPALKAAAKEGDWQASIGCIDSMTRAALKDKNAGPDVLSFNHALVACAKAGKCEVRAMRG